MDKNKIINLGCRLNIYEGEIIKNHLLKEKLHNITVINSCAVTEEAEKKVAYEIRKAKKINPSNKIVVTGCAAQIDPDKYNNISEVDRVVGNTEKLKLQTWKNLNLVNRVEVGNILEESTTVPSSIEKFEGKSRAYIEIQQGCDHRCTFCIIPFGRGNNRSVPAGEIVSKIKKMVKSGYNEVVLTGVDITDYGKDLPGKPTFTNLIKRILKLVPELKRLRLSSIDCAEIDDEFWDILENKRLMPHFHISLQAGNNMILKRMKRRHQREHAIDFCSKLKSIRPEVIFGADLIAGFPTETEEMFHNTLKIIDECDLTLLHIFPFSPMQKTPASKMPQVPRNIIKERAKILREKGQLKIKNKFKDTIGQKLNVLTEKDSFGYSENYLKVKITGNQKVDEGQIIPVYITGFSPSYLKAEI